MSSRDSVPRQIAQTEEAIAASDVRLKDLRLALLNAARRKLDVGNTRWFVAAAVVAMLGLALYPLRRPLMRHARLLLASPLVSTFARRVPLLGTLLPLLLNRRARSIRGLLMWAGSALAGLMRRR